MNENNSALSWIIKHSKRYIPYLSVLTVLGILISALAVAFSLVSKNVVDIASGQLSGNLLTAGVGLGVLIVGQLIVHILYSLIDVRVLGKLKITLKNELFSSILNKKWLEITKYHTGELQNRLYSDISVVTTGVVDIIPNAVSFIARIVLSFCALYMMDSFFAIMCLLVGPVILILTRIYSKYMKRWHKKCLESEGRVRSFLQECLQNLIVIKSFGNEKKIVENATTLQRNAYSLEIKRNNISVSASVVFSLLMTIAYYFTLGWCAYKLSVGLMSFGTLIAMLQLVGQVQAPFKELSAVIPKYYSMIASAERILDIEHMEDDACSSAIDTQKLYDDMSKIVVENLTFSYDDEKVLDNTGFEIEKGEFVAICGRSGIGKSTILKLLLSIIYPDSGHIYMKLSDGNEVAVSKDTRNLFAYVPQGNMILSGSIRDNIAFTNKTATEEDIIRCAKAADMWDYIETLPDGLDTVLGEKGLGLSEGQIQRLAIARALLYDAPILLLDEATSALDDATEKRVLGNIRAMNSKTCIFVSHKKAATEICDKNIMINNGKFEIMHKNN